MRRIIRQGIIAGLALAIAGVPASSAFAEESTPTVNEEQEEMALYSDPSSGIEPGAASMEPQEVEERDSRPVPGRLGGVDVGFAVVGRPLAVDGHCGEAVRKVALELGERHAHRVAEGDGEGVPLAEAGRGAAGFSTRRSAGPGPGRRDPPFHRRVLDRCEGAAPGWTRRRHGSSHAAPRRPRWPCPPGTTSGSLAHALRAPSP